MEQINNWEAAIKNKQGKYETALPLPGCYVLGEINGQKVIIENSYIDFTSQTVMTNENLQKQMNDIPMYKLGNAREGYLKMLNKFMQYAKENKKQENEIGE